jgi:hypothetical protein
LFILIYQKNVIFHIFRNLDKTLSVVIGGFLGLAAFVAILIIVHIIKQAGNYVRSVLTNCV